VGAICSVLPTATLSFPDFVTGVKGPLVGFVISLGKIVSRFHTAPWMVFLTVSGFCWAIFSTSTQYRIPLGVSATMERASF
jgi:hypothetical protein